MDMPYLPVNQTTKPPQQRLATIAVVSALHVALICALIVGLSQRIEISTPQSPIVIDVFHTKTAPPRPMPPDNPVPRHVSVIDTIPPIVNTQSDSTQNPITTTPAVPQTWQSPIQVEPVLTPARGIASTHTIPPYPPLAVRLNQQGNVQLSLTIDEQGNVTDATVMTSSGYDALDAAAVAWVKGHWRYQPATRDGHPVSATTNAIVTFRLTNRQG
jgi:protein TonB